MKRLAFAILAICLTAVMASAAVYTWETKADWDYWWFGDSGQGAEPWGHPNTRDEVQLFYHRQTVIPIQRREAGNLKRVLGWNNTTRLAIVKCGFCWIGEILENELGLQRVVGVQQSAYIQAKKSENEDIDIINAINAVNGLTATSGDGLTLLQAFRNGGNPRSSRPADILDIPVDTTDSRATLRNALGGPGFEILTYQYLSSLEDAEVAALMTALDRQTSGRITHLVWVELDWPPFINRTMDQLKAFAPAHTFINIQTWEVR